MPISDEQDSLFPSAGERSGEGDPAGGDGRPGHDIITIGTSAGGVDALKRLVRELDPDIPASLFVVQHFPPTSRSLLPQILGRAGRLPAEEARSGDGIVHGRIYVAPSDRHLLVHRGHVALSSGPKENRCRPAIDPLFRSAARSYGARVIGVVLTGNLDDGTAGLHVIKSAGGIAVVQDPDDASYAGMPRSALDNVSVDHVVSLAELPDLLMRLAREPVGALEESVGHSTGMGDVMAGLPERGLGSGLGHTLFTCPDCHGSMVEVRSGDMISFRCHVGHIFSPESLADGQMEALEQAIWTALAALEESIELSRRLAQRAREREHHATAEMYERRVKENGEKAALLRQALYKSSGMEPPKPITE